MILLCKKCKAWMPLSYFTYDLFTYLDLKTPVKNNIIIWCCWEIWTINQRVCIVIIIIYIIYSWIVCNILLMNFWTCNTVIWNWWILYYIIYITSYISNINRIWFDNIFLWIMFYVTWKPSILFNLFSSCSKIVCSKLF